MTIKTIKRAIHLGGAWVRYHVGTLLLQLAATLLRLPHIKIMYDSHPDLILALSSKPFDIKGIEVRAKGGNNGTKMSAWSREKAS